LLEADLTLVLRIRVSLVGRGHKYIFSVNCSHWFCPSKRSYWILRLQELASFNPVISSDQRISPKTFLWLSRGVIWNLTVKLTEYVNFQWMTFSNEHDVTIYLTLTHIPQSKTVNAIKIRFNTDKIIFIVLEKSLSYKYNITGNSWQMFAPFFSSFFLLTFESQSRSRWSWEWSSPVY
jgi:hypothetical protein